MKLTSLVVLVPALLGQALAGSSTTEVFQCESGGVVAETWIGANKNVLAQTIMCGRRRSVRGITLDSRQTPTNVCGAQCNTNCFLPAGGGPDPNDCHVIADALRYESQNTGATFQIGTLTNNTVVMQYSTCKSFFLNQAVGPLAYCRTDWAALIDWVAPNCQATQNAHGGNCVAADQSWFVQVEHS